MADLFAGTGALGIEALSRGAASVTFVERDPTSVDAVRANLAAVGLAGGRGRRRRHGRSGPTSTRGWPGRLALRPRAVRPAVRLRRAGTPWWPGFPATSRCSNRAREIAAADGVGGTQIQALWGYHRHGRPSGSGHPERCLVRIALIPGSFDPVHNGHLEVIERASRLFDEVVVAALRNPQKSEALFDDDERREMLEETVAHLANVRIVSMSTLVVNVAQEVGASAIVKGLRAVSDFENELQMAQMNKQLSGVETLFIPTSSAHSFIASRLLREVARFGGDVTAFVPKVVAQRLEEKFADE